MTREELLARISSRELSEWLVLFEIHGEEARRARDSIESGDGQVIVTGLDDEEDDVDA